MIQGRLIGILVAVLLAEIFTTSEIWLKLILWLVFSVIGLGIGLAVSLVLGININTDFPTKLDSEKYWTDKYGEDLGKQAYQVFLNGIPQEPDETSTK